MALSHFRALALLHRTFHRHSPAQRLHLIGRYLSAPLLRTLEFVPQHARVLDIGAGHGMWPRLVAEARDARVVALDPDVRKMRRAFRHPRVRFVAGYDECIRGEFEAVALFDVLYLMPDSARDALFGRIFDRLRPGGTLLVKDLDPTRRLKAAWNRTQETISVKFLHLSRGKGLFANDAPAEVMGRMHRTGFVDVQSQRVDRWYPHAHILYVARKPISSGTRRTP